MKNGTKKPVTLDEAANQLTTIIEKHLEKLPPSERKRRIKKAHERIIRAVARKKIRDLPLKSSKPSKQLGTLVNRLTVGSR